MKNINIDMRIKQRKSFLFLNRFIKKKRKYKYTRLYKTAKFLIKFNLFAIPLYLVIISGFTWPFMMQVTQGIAFAVLRLIGVDAEIADGFIVVPVSNGNFAATVSWDSTGWKSMLAFFALVFATDFSLRKKFIGLLFIPMIYGINILRIVFMFFFVSKYDVAYYNILHETLWSWGLIITILVLWIAWMKYVKVK